MYFNMKNYLKITTTTLLNTLYIICKDEVQDGQA